jgi:hypothetical protein
MFITVFGGTQAEGTQVFDALHGAFGGASRMRITLKRAGRAWAIADCQTFPGDDNCIDDVAAALRAAGLEVIHDQEAASA